MRRRDLLVIAGLFAVAIAIPPYLRRRASTFDLVELEGFPGFRRRAGTSVQSNAVLFVGLEGQPTKDKRWDSASLCDVLFGDEGWRSDPLTVAVFSDYYCPYCAILDQRLDKMRKAGLPIRLSFHELPLLGSRSRWAAQVALAAGRQMPHDQIHLDLMQRGVKPGLAGLRDVATRHGLDLRKLQEDAQGAEIRQEIEAGLALGRTLGIVGTPGTFIGRTLLLGALSEADIDAMFTLEREEPFSGCR